MHDDSVVRGEERNGAAAAAAAALIIIYSQNLAQPLRKGVGEGEGGRRLRARKKDHHEARFEIAPCHKKVVRGAR